MAGNYILISLQIVLSALVIYRIQRFIRTHRTWELAFILLAFSIGTIIISQPEFNPFPKSVFYAGLCFFLLILICEPEIAALLNQLAERMNPNSLNRKKVAIGEIARAAMAMAATKTGALIAFERSESLLKFGETGIEINADIKKELITTLFFKNTATHDGGLIIREGRASHCGAVFPLSERKHMENGLGTRHRAALGLSENTDAVCLVVSEEEGTISLTKNGELFYAIPAKQLEAKLCKLLSGTERFRFYPFHYIKHLSPKLVQENYIQFTQSFSEKIYELIALFYCSTTFWFLNANGIIKITDYYSLSELLVTRPWILIPAILLGLNLMMLLSGRNVKVNGISNEIRIEYRFLFFPVWKKTVLRENLKAVTLKHEKTGMNLWSLVLFNKKKRTYLLDRSTSAKSLIEYAKKIKDVLKIDLVN